MSAVTSPRLSVGSADVRLLRAVTETAAAAVSAGVAGLGMMMPIGRSWVSPGSAMQVDLLIFNMPLALTIGALISVIAVSVSCAIGNDRLAWCAVFCATAAMLVNHVLLVRLETRTLSTLNYVDSMLAGVILGCLAAAVWQRRAPAAGYLFGALTSILVADLTPAPDGRTDALRGAPPVWLIVAAIALMLFTAVLYRQGPGTEPDDSTVVPLKPVVAAVVIVTTILGTSVWLAHGVTVTTAVAAVAVLLAATTVAALLLPGRDGLLVVVMVAFATAGSAVLVVPRPGWSTVPIVVIAGVALYVGWRDRQPLRAVAGSVLLAIIGVAGAALVDDPSAVITVAGCLVVATVAGYTLGCAVGAHATGAVVGIAVLFIPSAGVALQGHDFGRVEYSQSWYRSAETTNSALPGIVSAVIALGCALVVLLVGRLRPAR